MKFTAEVPPKVPTPTQDLLHNQVAPAKLMLSPKLTQP